jgi:hypothetical protein
MADQNLGLNGLNFQQLEICVNVMADVGCQEGEMLLGTPQRQNQVGTNIHVLRMCARRLGVCELLPLLVGQKNMRYNNMVFWLIRFVARV